MQIGSPLAAAITGALLLCAGCAPEAEPEFENAGSASVETEAERQVGLQQAVDATGAAIDAEDWPAMFDLLPPTLMAHMQELSGLTAEGLRSEAVAAIAATMESAEFVSYGLDVPGATFGRSAHGLSYALVPTRFELNIDGLSARGTSTTLGVEEDGRWYLVRLTADQMPHVRTAFPSLAHLEFPPETMELIE